jgi:Rap1a immunity proteins
MAMTLAAVAESSISALAGDYTTQDLLNDCHRQDKSFCLGYLAGAAGILFEMHDNGVDTVPTKQENVRLVLSACAIGTTFGAMRQAFINWAEKNPRQWAFSASI